MNMRESCGLAARSGCTQVTPACSAPTEKRRRKAPVVLPEFAPHLDSRGAGYWLLGFKRVQAPPSPLRNTSTSNDASGHAASIQPAFLNNYVSDSY